MPEGFRITRMYHPSFHAPDLAEVESWFERVFGFDSTNIYETFKGRDTGSYPTDYSTFTPLADVLMDTIQPSRYVLNGVQQYASVDTPHLKTIGWFAENSEGVYRSLRAAGIAMVDQYGQPAEGEEAPRSAGGGAMPLYFTVPASSGLRHEVLPDFPFALDHRNAAGWAPGPPAGALGIERCAFHTLLTDDPRRALRTVVDALGGTVFRTGRDEVIGAAVSYVHLADTVLQIAVPDEGTAAYADWTTTAPDDTYHSLTFKVADLDRAAAHLKSQGVGIRAQTGDTLVTDPDTSAGVPWGFTTRLVPGDPRP